MRSDRSPAFVAEPLGRRELRQVGHAIATYMYEIIRYLTFNTDGKPFPFGAAWPSGEAKD